MIYEYDARNDKCPLPLVKLRVILKKMTGNDRCILLIADSGSKSDIPKLLDKYEYPYRMTSIENNAIKIQIESR